MRKFLLILLTIVAASVITDLAQDTNLSEGINLSCSNCIELPATSSCRDAASYSMEHNGSFRQISLADIGFIAPQNISVPGAPSVQFTKSQSTGARAVRTYRGPAGSHAFFLPRRTHAFRAHLILSPHHKSQETTLLESD